MITLVNAFLIACSSKEKGNFIWIEIVISLSVLSLTSQLKANYHVGQILCICLHADEGHESKTKGFHV